MTKITRSNANASSKLDTSADIPSGLCATSSTIEGIDADLRFRSAVYVAEGLEAARHDGLGEALGDDVLVEVLGRKEPGDGLERRGGVGTLVRAVKREEQALRTTAAEVEIDR